MGEKKKKKVKGEKKEKKEEAGATEEFSAPWFQEILDDVKAKCEKKIKIKSKDKEAFTQACDSAYQNWTNKMENEKYLDELMENKGASKKEIEEAQKFAEESSKAQPK